MATFNLEKILYFADKQGDKGFHVGVRDLQNNTTISQLVKQARGSKFLLDLPDGEKKGKYYGITPLGKIKLAVLQFEYSQRKYGETLKPEHAEGLLSVFSELLGDRSIVLLKTLERLHKAPFSLKDEGVSTDVRKDLQRLGLIETAGNGEKGNTTVRISSVFSPVVDLHVSSLGSKQESDSVDYHDDILVDVLFKSFGSESVYTQYHDENFSSGEKHGVSLDDLVNKELITIAAQDDAGVHYKMSYKGASLMLNVELNMRKDAGFPTDEVEAKIEHLSIMNSIDTFDEAMTFDRYANEGRALVEREFGKEVLSHLPELFWDGHHFDKTSLGDVLKEVLSTDYLTPKNSVAPPAKDKPLISSADHVFSLMGDIDVSIEQMKGAVIFDILKQGGEMPLDADLDEVVRDFIRSKDRTIKP